VKNESNDCVPYNLDRPITRAEDEAELESEDIDCAVEIKRQELRCPKGGCISPMSVAAAWHDMAGGEPIKDCTGRGMTTLHLRACLVDSEPLVLSDMLSAMSLVRTNILLAHKCTYISDSH